MANDTKPYVFPDTPKGSEDPRKRPYASMSPKKSDESIKKANFWDGGLPGDENSSDAQVKPGDTG